MWFELAQGLLQLATIDRDLQTGSEMSTTVKVLTCLLIASPLASATTLVERMPQQPSLVASADHEFQLADDAAGRASETWLMAVLAVAALGFHSVRRYRVENRFWQRLAIEEKMEDQTGGELPMSPLHRTSSVGVTNLAKPVAT